MGRTTKNVVPHRFCLNQNHFTPHGYQPSATSYDLEVFQVIALKNATSPCFLTQNSPRRAELLMWTTPKPPRNQLANRWKLQVFRTSKNLEHLQLRRQAGKLGGANFILVTHGDCVAGDWNSSVVLRHLVEIMYICLVWDRENSYVFFCCHSQGVLSKTPNFRS